MTPPVSPSRDARGIALVGDETGRFRIIRDDMKLCREDQTSLLHIVDRASAEKAGNFLKAVNDQRAAFGWELNVMVEGGLIAWQFAGSKAGEETLIVGGPTRGDVARVSEDLMAMNNEQSAALRNALKDLSLFQRDQAERDTRMFDELSRLNNELVTLQREVSRKNFELQRLNELKNVFLGMASHDLRKPISAAQMIADMILAGSAGPVTDEQAKLLLGVTETCRIVTRQLNDFLDIAQIESGRLRVEVASWDLGKLAASKLSIHRKLAEAKGIRIGFSAEPRLPEALIDAARAGQVFDNYVENAIKYSPRDSTVFVRVGLSGEGIELSVRDQGSGLRPDQMEKMFQAFGTVGVKTTGGERSSGLGLAIVKAIMTEHRGRAWVQSAPGEGATFYAWFPKA